MSCAPAVDASALRSEAGRNARVDRGADIAFFLENLEGGGVQKVTLSIAEELARRGHRSHVLVCRMDGPLLGELPPALEVHALRPVPALVAWARAVRADPGVLKVLIPPVLLPGELSATLPYLPALVQYLRHSRPKAVFAATPYMNAEAVLARRMAGVPCRLLVSEHNDLSQGHPLGRGFQGRFLAHLCQRTYPQADAVVAVSNGLAADVAVRTGLPRDRVTTIYNPVVSSDLLEKARRPLDHPWFQPGSPPVILGAGRLGKGKDFETLLRAFARVRRKRPARLIILGKAKNERGDRQDKRQAELWQLAAQLGVAEDLSLPGFVQNPFPYMARAAVFAVSSIYEGFCNVLVEAMACGCPVASTDCPSGPSEILENGKYGPLVPVRDDAALAEAIANLMENPSDPELLRRRAEHFQVGRSLDIYEQLLVGEAP